jgi:DHA1 family bicyclomycin/chloramphenicol resistance-like MFS transporter
MFLIAPIIGALILTYMGWRYIFVLLAISPIGIFVSLYKNLPETLIQKKRTLSLFKQIKLLTFNKQFFATCLLHSLPVALATIYVASSAFIFIEIFHFSPIAYAFVNGITVICNLCAATTYRQYIGKLGFKRSLKIGLFFMVLFIACGISALAFNLSHNIYLMIIGVCCFNIGMPYCIITGGTLAVDLAQNNNGLAVSYTAFIRNGSMAIATMTSGFLYNQTAIPTYLSMLLTSLMIVIIGFYTISFLKNKKS